MLVYIVTKPVLNDLIDATVFIPLGHSCLYGIAWYYILFNCIAMYSMSFHCIVCHGMVLYSI